MKQITIIAFRGTGFRNPKYKDEPVLIRAGHVGFQLEDDPIIYGFHPTKEAVEKAGGIDQLIELLKQHQRQPGSVQDDTSVFVRAHELSQAGGPTDVYVISYDLTEDEFKRIYTDVTTLYETQKRMWYNFPYEDGTFDEGDSNCAFFPNLIGIPIPSRNGLVKVYVKEMKKNGAKIWHPPRQL